MTAMTKPSLLKNDRIRGVENLNDDEPLLERQ